MKTESTLWQHLVEAVSVLGVLFTERAERAVLAGIVIACGSVMVLKIVSLGEWEWSNFALITYGYIQFLSLFSIYRGGTGAAFAFVGSVALYPILAYMMALSATGMSTDMLMHVAISQLLPATAVFAGVPIGLSIAFAMFILTYVSRAFETPAAEEEPAT